MIPSNNKILSEDLELLEQPSKSYGMIFEENRVEGYQEGLESIKHSVFNILNTERYEFIIYDWNYGVELKDLFGMPMSYVVSEVPRRIKEALIVDDRIEDVIDFEFYFPKKRVLYTRFKVASTIGDFEWERAVDF